MEVREPDARYLTAVQRTDLGELPADWAVVPLGKFEPFITSGSRGWAAYYADMGSTFLRITNLSRSCIYPSLKDLRYVAVPPDNSEGMRTALKAGDVLISITADIGIVGLVTEAVALPAYINQHIALVRFAADAVNSQYVAYFLAGAAAQRRFKSMTDAGAKAGMNLAGVREVLAALPPSTNEQAAIAAALTDADALIDSLEQLLTKKRQIKQGAMQELLTGKRRLPGYTSPWHPRRIGSFAPLQRGFDLPARARKSGEYPVVYSNGILNFHSEFMVKGPGVVTGRSGTIGAVTFVEQNYWPHNTALWVTDFNSSDPKFVFYLLQHIGLDRFATGSGVPTLNRNDVHAFVVHVPSSVGEQAEISQVLSDIDTELATLESRLTKARALKQAMAQALLTGRIRLVEKIAA